MGCVQRTDDIESQTLTSLNLELVPVPANMTHFFQPLDLKVTDLQKHLLAISLLSTTLVLLRWDGSHSAEVNENINLGYSQDQGYS